MAIKIPGRLMPSPLIVMTKHVYIPPYESMVASDTKCLMRGGKGDTALATLFIVTR